jgi:hypothetical protein
VKSGDRYQFPRGDVTFISKAIPVTDRGGLRDVKDPALFGQSAHRWRRGCQLYALAAALLTRNIIFLLLIIISVNGGVNARA